MRAVWKDSIFAQYERERLGQSLPEGCVPASGFWLVENGELIGTGSVRHRLTPALERFGGHNGYTICPLKWKMGYGTRQLGLLLGEALKLGIETALVTCDDDNIGSNRVIEKTAASAKTPSVTHRVPGDTGFRPIPARRNVQSRLRTSIPHF